jgi:hypothetical protein
VHQQAAFVVREDIVKRRFLTILWIRCGFFLLAPIALVNAQPAAKGLSSVHTLVDQYCAGCHNSDKKKGDLDLESISNDEITGHSVRGKK